MKKRLLQTCLLLFIFLPPSISFSQNSENWLTHQAGIEALDDDFVLPPFTPINATDNGQISVWGRTYHLDSLGLIHQVDIQNQPYFDNGMSLNINISNLPASIMGISQELISNHKGKVVYLSKGQLMVNGTSAGEIQIKTSVEYDGMVRVDLTLVPTGSIDLTGLSYTVSYPGDKAVFLRYDSAIQPYSISKSISRNIPKETFYLKLPSATGTLWHSSFKTSVWIGDLHKGFLWFSPSEQNWSPQERSDRANALSVTRSPGGDVQLTVTPVSKSYTIDRAVTYTFGFFATPVRPYPEGWRGWSDVYTKTHEGKILYYPQNEWSQYPFYPKIKDGFSDQLQNLVAQKEQDGHYIMPYLDPTIMTVSENIPESQYLNEWQILPATSWKFNGLTQYRISTQSHWVDFYCYLMDKLAKTGIKGTADLDEWMADYDINQAHGAGYVDQNGIQRGNYDLFAKRDFIKRLCAIFLKENGQPPIIIAHAESALGLPFMSFASAVLTGENSNTNYYEKPDYYDDYTQNYYNQITTALDRNPSGTPGKYWYYYAYPLERWQAEDTGTAFGLPVMVMTNLMKSKGIDSHYAAGEIAARDFMTMPIVHDNLVWPLFVASGVIYDVWKARSDFGIDAPNVEFYPYWGNDKIAQSPDPDIYISAYKNNDKWLLCISNLGLNESDFTVQINSSLLGKTSISSIVYAIRGLNGTTKAGQEIPPHGSTFTLHLNARDFTMIIMK